MEEQFLDLLLYYESAENADFTEDVKWLGLVEVERNFDYQAFLLF